MDASCAWVNPRDVVSANEAPVTTAPVRLALVSVEESRYALVRFCPLKSQPVRSLDYSPMPCKFFV